MHDGTRDEVSVSFPASADFSKIGRVTVAGLALRLGVDIADVEKLRLAVDRAVEALHGNGRIHLSARWEPSHLTITIDNPAVLIDQDHGETMTAALTEIVNEVHVEPSSIRLVLASEKALRSRS